MNVVNLPMLESAVAKKMQKDKPALGHKDGKDTDSKKRGLVPEEYAQSLRSMGIETNKKKQKTDDETNKAHENVSHLQCASDDEMGGEHIASGHDDGKSGSGSGNLVGT